MANYYQLAKAFARAAAKKKNKAFRDDMLNRLSPYRYDSVNYTDEAKRADAFRKELAKAEAGQIEHPEYRFSGTTYWYEPYRKPVTEIDRHNLSEQFREVIGESLEKHANSQFGFNWQNQLNAVYDDLKDKRITAQDVLDPEVMKRYDNVPRDNRRSNSDWRLRWIDDTPFKPFTSY